MEPISLQIKELVIQFTNKQIEELSVTDLDSFLFIQLLLTLQTIYDIELADVDYEMPVTADITDFIDRLSHRVHEKIQRKQVQ